jgi:hypothetical protein
VRVFVFVSHSPQNAIRRVPGYIAALPALVTCNLEGNPIENLDNGMTFTLTQFNLKSSSEMVKESWRHHEQVVTTVKVLVSRCRLAWAQRWGATPHVAARASRRTQGNRPAPL